MEGKREGHHFKRFVRCYAAVNDVLPTKLEQGKVDDARWFSLDEVRALIHDHPDQVTDGLKQVIERYY